MSTSKARRVERPSAHIADLKVAHRAGACTLRCTSSSDRPTAVFSQSIRRVWRAASTTIVAPQSKARRAGVSAEHHATPGSAVAAAQTAQHLRVGNRDRHTRSRRSRNASGLARWRPKHPLVCTRSQLPLPSSFSCRHSLASPPSLGRSLPPRPFFFSFTLCLHSLPCPSPPLFFFWIRSLIFLSSLSRPIPGWFLTTRTRRWGWVVKNRASP